MAFDQSTRNRLQKFVTEARRVLEEEFTRQLQNDYGLDPMLGTASSIESLRHINDQQRATARILRDTLAHYCAGPETDKKAGLERIVREQAFTVLNRLAALRMAEARGLLTESVGHGYQAQGFQLYARVAGAGLGETGHTYRVYLQSVFDELSEDLPGLFDRFAPQGRLFPREAALLQVLAAVNHGEIEHLWAEDETIGWIYQYFNSKEERKAMRDASQAPRNSRELAVRNQFFTPRYVVEFLVDNTLGRLWFNWTGGQTELRDRCQYLLVKPDEQPDAAERLRDPRTIKLLDPACGSMHFGLYAFDLFVEIYREAWAWEQAHGPGCLDTETGGNADLKPLSQTYADQDAFLHDVPRLIIEHNIYGVDIDPRAAQIASLALWLRAQRAWHEAGVKAQDRPRVGRGNVVAAVAPPAQLDLRKQFMKGLDRRDADLFEKTLYLLKGLPELGVLLEVENELPALVRAVFAERGDLFREQDIAQWQKAEIRLRDALTEFAHAGQSAYQGRLFAEDALQGLRMIDLCSELFDVVVMNPPFGDKSRESSDYLKVVSGQLASNLFCSFVARGVSLAPNGFLGAITDSTWLKKADYEAFRSLLLDGSLQVSTLIDFGWGVLDDANVATCAFVAANGIDTDVRALGLGSYDADAKEGRLRAQIALLRTRYSHEDAGLDFVSVPRAFFSSFPGRVIAYEAPASLLPLFNQWGCLSANQIDARRGYTPGDTFRFFKTWWEVPQEKLGATWRTLNNGGSFSPLIDDGLLVAKFDCVWAEYRSLSGFRLESADWFGEPGVGWGKRTDFMYAYPTPSGGMFSNEGHCAFPKNREANWALIAYFCSSLGQDLINLFCGQHKLAGYVSKVPCPALNSSEMVRAGELAKLGWEVAVEICRTNEQSEFYECWYLDVSDPWTIELELRGACSNYLGKLSGIDSQIDLLAESATGERLDSYSRIKRPKTYLENYVESFDWASSLLSGVVGQIFTSSQRRSEASRFNQKRSSPFGSVEYRDIAQSAEHVILSNELLLRLISDFFHENWPLNGDEIERRILQRLQHTDLLGYFSKPTGFFGDHLERFTKGRRKAPIYWPISTSSGSYTLWLYYPILSDQTLFAAVNDFVEPKLGQISRDVVALRTKGSARSRDDERAFEALQTLELELIELRETLLQIAPTYRPNHDDGVQITAAPLWPLFCHKPWQTILKDTWMKLEEGDYDWAHLAIAYWPDRVREKCKTDKSLAIAHDLEHLYVEPPPKAPKARGREKQGDA